MKRNNLSKLFAGKSFLGQRSPWTKVSLENCPLDILPLGQRSLWTTFPWTNVSTHWVGPNKLIVEKFATQIILAPKDMYPKFWVKNKFWVKKYFGVKKILSQKIFWCQKNFVTKKMLDLKKKCVQTCVQNYLWSKKNWVLESFEIRNILGPRNVGSDKLCFWALVIL